MCQQYTDNEIVEYKVNTYVYISAFTATTRSSLALYTFTTLIYHKVLINVKTEQDTEQDTTYIYDKRSRMPTPIALLSEILINYYIWSEKSS